MKKIPNILSAFRIVLIPFLFFALIKDQSTLAAILLFLSGVTDLLDGWIARRFDAITPLGKILDPIADKLTQAVLSITLMITYARYWFFFAIIIIKELLMLILGGNLVRKHIRIEGAKIFGKVNTVVFYLVMFILIVFTQLSDSMVILLLTVTTVMSVISGLLYIPDYIAYRKRIINS